MANEFTVGAATDFRGLSTDTKPTTGIKVGSTYYELDTGKCWVFSDNENPVTTNGWWEI